MVTTADEGHDHQSRTKAVGKGHAERQRNDQNRDGKQGDFDHCEYPRENALTCAQR